MNRALIILCLTIVSCNALPTQPLKSSVLDFLKDLEDVVQEDGKLILTKMVNVIHHVEDALLQVKELIPKVNEKIHQEADEVLAGLKKLTDKVQELIGKQKVYYGFDLLGKLTELSGGTDLATALDLLRLAGKAHQVIQDAKEFMPRLEKTLDKLQAKVEQHVSDFAQHVLKEIGLPKDALQQSIINRIVDLFGKVEDEAHILLLDLLHKMEETFDEVKTKLPEEYERMKKHIEELRSEIHDLIVDIEKTLVMRSFSILDLAGNVSGGTSLSTAFKVMSLIDKFNTVVQDMRNFSPNAEKLLQHSVKKVADSAQDFFNHAALKLMQD